MSGVWVMGRSGSGEAGMSDEALEMIAGRFRLLAEPMRLRLLQALQGGERTVGDLVEVTGATQANVSKHLGMLYDARIVARRKEGLNSYYRIADSSIFDLCDLVCTSLGEKLAAQHEVMRGLGRK
ncbi:MAG: winged helix-turn-helix transcriptional regulator [Blastocatellales bacterium]|nr:winged helix-turn-helix transcriptional regulator [Blastocatellales bacterium]